MCCVRVLPLLAPVVPVVPVHGIALHAGGLSAAAAAMEVVGQLHAVPTLRSADELGAHHLRRGIVLLRMGILTRVQHTCAANEDGGKHPTHNLSHNCLEIKIVYKCLFYLGHLEGGGVGAAVGLLA